MSSLTTSQVVNYSGIQEKILNLLGSGISPEHVANTCGVTPSYVSQLMSQEDFAARVVELRYESLQKHNKRDEAYDKIEDELVEKLKDLMPLMVRPMEVLKAIQVINQAKRRGQSAPEQITNTQNIVNISMPTQIIQKFKVNPQNQVIAAGTQELITMQSGSLLKEIKGLVKGIENKGDTNDDLSSRTLLIENNS